MARVRLLIGTQKGAFIATSDGARRDWVINGTHFGGWEMYHLCWISGRSRSALRVAVLRLVWPDHPAF